MIDDEKFNSLGDMVDAHIQGSRPVEEVSVELLYAILSEMRTLRKSNHQLAEQFNIVSSGGNALLTERAS